MRIRTLVWRAYACGSGLSSDCGGPRRGTRHDTGDRRGKRLHPQGSGRLAPPRRSRTSASPGSNRTSFSHAVSLAEATCEV